MSNYGKVGGVLEIVILELKKLGDNPELVHQKAAQAGMKVIKGRLEKPPSRFVVNYTIPSTCIAIKPEQFLGERYDPENETLRQSAQSQYATTGYADAFLEPPNGLSLDKKEALVLFKQINTELFASIDTTLDIRQWPTDWSNVFDDGKEWWGAHFWTVFVPSKKWVVVICASSTD